MQLTKRMALALALCLMMSMMTAALTEATEAMPELTEAAAPEAAEALPEAAPETVEPTPEAAEAAPVEGASGDAEGEVSLDAIMDEAAPATEAEAPGLTCEGSHASDPGKRETARPVGRTVSLLAAGEGFEPSQTESESVVLPLHNPAKRK